MTEGNKMGHIKVSATRAERTPSEWLPVGARIGDLVNTWAGRSDIVAYVGPGAGGQTPACFNPLCAEVEVNVEVAFGKGISPEMIGDISKRDTLFDWPRASGAIFHEALHARYSRFSLEEAQKELSKYEFQAFMSLEESRIEKHGVDNFPANRVFLRSCALEIVLHDVQQQADEHLAHGVRSIAGLAALTCARVDAGSLDSEDVEEIKAIVIEHLGQDVYDAIREIWIKFQAHDNHTNPAYLYELVREWEKILSQLAKETGEQPEAGAPADKGILVLVDAVLEELKEAIEEAASNVAIATGNEVQEQEQKEDWQEVVDLRSKDARQKRDHEQVAHDVFSASTAEINSTGSGSLLKETRSPTPAERAAAVKIAQLLEKAKYRERDETEIQSILPPGRLRTRAVVQQAAYKAQGSMMNAEPWKRTVRKQTDDPTLKVGVMVDISGSMSAAMEPMAATAWAMSEAARRVQGRCAMVYYGSGVFPTLKPGQHLDQVKVFTAPDATEKFDKAFKSLDGSLGLLQSTGARLLVVVSDGVYTETELDKARHWVKECDRNGVAVLWLSYANEGYNPHRGYLQKITEGTSTQVIENITDPSAAALKIGQAAAKALEKIGRKNAA
jgi:Mg-chelatase subunit ChlD